VSSRSARLPGRTLPPQPTLGGSFTTGVVVGGATAAILHALVGLLRGPQQQSAVSQFVVGGVDLSRTDLTQPFFIDFSVPSSGSLSTKHAAFQRLRHAFEELHRWQPVWLYRPESDVEAGRFSLYVIPLPLAGRAPTTGEVVHHPSLPLPPQTVGVAG